MSTAIVGTDLAVASAGSDFLVLGYCIHEKILKCRWFLHTDSLQTLTMNIFPVSNLR